MKLIVTHSASNLSTLLKILPANTRWFAFNEPLSAIKRWKAALPPGARIPVAKNIEKIYLTEYKKYSRELVGLTKRFKCRPEWWLTPISERNGWPPEQVIGRCIVNLVSKLECENLLIVTSDVFVKNELKVLARRKGISFHSIGWAKYWRNSFKRKLVNLAGAAYLLYEYLAHKTLAKRYKQKPNPLQSILIRTHGHPSSFKNEYINPNFGQLGDYLAKTNSIVYQPSLVLLNKKERKLAYRWLKDGSSKDRANFFLLWPKLTLKNLVYAYRIMLKYRKFGSAINIGRNYLKSLVPATLNFTPSRVIFEWENKAYEKHMCLLFKKYFPATKVIGYLNGLPFPTGPEINLSEEEASITPLPDKLICSSKYAYDQMVAAGYDKRKLAIGPSLRQGYIFERTFGSHNRCGILVALTLNENISEELLGVINQYAWALLKSKNTLKSQKIFIKSHPNLDINKILPANLCPNVKIVNENLGKLLERAEHFIYCGPTTTACEALVSGNIVHRFVSNNFFSLDCLYNGFRDEANEFTCAEELAKNIKKARPLGLATLRKYKDYIFGNPKKYSYDIFLE